MKMKHLPLLKLPGDILFLLLWFTRIIWYLCLFVSFFFCCWCCDQERMYAFVLHLCGRQRRSSFIQLWSPPQGEMYNTEPQISMGKIIGNIDGISLVIFAKKLTQMQILLNNIYKSLILSIMSIKYLNFAYAKNCQPNTNSDHCDWCDWNLSMKWYYIFVCVVSIFFSQLRNWQIFTMKDRQYYHLISKQFCVQCLCVCNV